MSPAVARWFLVPAAVLLVAAAFAVPASGVHRAVLLASAACCALLDTAVRRGPGHPAGTVAPVGRGRGRPFRTGSPTRRGRLRQVGRGSDGDRRTPSDSRPGPSPCGGRSTATAAAAGTALTLGVFADGTGATVPVGIPGRSTHVVVLGRGPLAEAVHRGLADQLVNGHAAGSAGGDRLRWCSADDVGDASVLTAPDGPMRRADLRSGPPGSAPGAPGSASAPPDSASGPPDSAAGAPPPGAGPSESASGPSGRPFGATLPAGTSIAVSFDGDGPAVAATVVLVPGLRQLPRVWDALVEVSRYGCTLRTRDDAVARVIDPVLPLIVPDSPDDGPTRSRGPT